MGFFGDPQLVVHGGTGAATLPDKGLVVGAGTAAVGTLAPGAAGNVATSDGVQWTSAPATGGGGTTTHTYTERVTFRLYGAYNATDYQSNLELRFAALPA